MIGRVETPFASRPAADSSRPRVCRIPSAVAAAVLGVAVGLSTLQSPSPARAVTVGMGGLWEGTLKCKVLNDSGDKATTVKGSVSLLFDSDCNLDDGQLSVFSCSVSISTPLDLGPSVWDGVVEKLGQENASFAIAHGCDEDITGGSMVGEIKNGKLKGLLYSGYLFAGCKIVAKQVNVAAPVDLCP